eukprot:TRINITY_DN15310_c0_g1_i5.p1 TRINITY_DN15310_c0_g1~~TRINITY_DN15310_c0_g1_i5.p1  ORF type:complete len:395 (-),score=167.98 TRINITY_DN15310_c0_g1_i5:659-1843(-)
MRRSARKSSRRKCWAKAFRESTRKLKASKKKIAEKEENIQQAEMLNKTLADELEAAKRQIQQLAIRVRELKETQELNASRSEMRSSDGEIYKENYDKFLRMIDERDKQIKELIHIIEGLESSQAESENKNSFFIDQLDEMERQMKYLKESQSLQVERLTNDNKRLVLENEALRDDKNSLIETLKQQVVEKEAKLKSTLIQREEELTTQIAARERQMKESADQLKVELTKSIQNLTTNAESLRNENLSLRGELLSLKNSYEEKLKEHIEEIYNKDQAIATLEKHIHEAAKEQLQSESKGAIIEELKQNSEEISAIKKEYKKEVDRLSSMLGKMTHSNERLEEKCRESMNKLRKAEDIIEEYKRVIDNLSRSKETKLNELISAEEDNSRLRKTLDV